MKILMILYYFDSLWYYVSDRYESTITYNISILLIDFMIRNSLKQIAMLKSLNIKQNTISQRTQGIDIIRIDIEENEILKEILSKVIYPFGSYWYLIHRISKDIINFSDLKVWYGVTIFI